MESMSCLVVSLACIIPVAIFLIRSKNLPPGPLALPIIGHMHLFRSLPHQVLHSLSKRHGPLMHIRLGSVLCVVASSLEIAKEFLQTKESSFANRPNSLVIDILSHGGQSFTFCPYGPFSKFMKKVSLSECLGAKTLGLSLPVRQEELRLYLERLHRKADAGEAIDVRFEASRLINNIISRMVMSKRFCENESEVGDLQRLVKDMAELMLLFNLSDYIWFLKNIDLQGHKKRSFELIEQFDSVIEKIIEEREEAGMKKLDLLDIMLDVSRDEASPIKLSIDGIKATILDILLAATGTSVVTLQWALSELINNPDIMEKASREIDMVVGKDKLVQESDIPNLPYLQAIVKESFRLHPTGPMILRESSEDCKVGGYHIPAKTRVLINLWAIGRDPNVWENPLEFRPERFIGSDHHQKVDVRGQHFELLIFGTGRRICPGISLALQVVHTTLAAMIQCFEWKTEGGKVDMKEGAGITLVKAHPLVCFPVAKQESLPI